MKIKLLLAICLPLAAACTEKPDEAPAAAVNAAQQPAALSRSASAEDARVFFISPADGDTVNNPIRVVFGTEGMVVVPAGNDTPHSGHHHLLIDTELPELGLPIPKDEHHVHFGDGSTETEIMLEPGEHTLQLLLGDHLHIPHDPPLNSARITVTVK
jgi:hypothetical protein